jgi:hypothetical protein
VVEAVRITGRARLDPTVRATEHNTNISRYPIPNAVQALLNAMCPPRRGIASRLVRSLLDLAPSQEPVLAGVWEG